MKKNMRGGWISAELFLTLAVVVVISALAATKALEAHKENVLEKLYMDTTYLLNKIVATDNIDSYIGFLRAGNDCLDSNTYDPLNEKVNFEKMGLCLKSDLSGYKENIEGKGNASFFRYAILPCTLSLKGSVSNSSEFTLMLDCSEVNNEAYRTNIMTRMDDYSKSRDMWKNLHLSNSLDADKKILTMNLRL